MSCAFHCAALVFHTGTEWASITSEPCPLDTTGEGLHDGACFCDE